MDYDPDRSSIWMGNTGQLGDKTDAIRKRYERRKHIIQRIRKLAANHGTTEEDIFLQVDRWRQRKHYSINTLGKEIHKESENGGWRDEELLGCGEEEPIVM